MTTLTLLAVPALAGALLAGPVAGDSGDSGDELAQICSRIPNRIERVEKAQVRLGADAATTGSIARVQARLDRAQAEGHTDLARLLRDRLAIREDVAAVLPDILVHLKDAQQLCTR
jgi:hypothetical protein